MISPTSSPAPKFKFTKSTEEPKFDVSDEIDNEVSPKMEKTVIDNERPAMSQRKGFIAPKQKPNFYGDSDSDDDFQ